MAVTTHGLPKKALVEVLKGIVDEIDQNKSCNACCTLDSVSREDMKPPRSTTQCRGNACRLVRGNTVSPLITEPDYRKRGVGEWNYIIPLPPPLKVRSRELIASRLYSGCSCQKKNGLQDNCRRWDCRGYPYCCKTGTCMNSGGNGCDGSLCRKG